MLLLLQLLLLMLLLQLLLLYAFYHVLIWGREALPYNYVINIYTRSSNRSSRSSSSSSSIKSSSSIWIRPRGNILGPTQHQGGPTFIEGLRVTKNK